jgi:hypothetical protein
MSFTLSMSGVIVGRSDLETRDPETHIARGVFRPGLGYELTQPIFALYAGSATDPDTLSRYRKARDALRLALTDAAGAPVSLRELHIRPDSAAGSQSSRLVLEIETDDPAVWTTATS